MLGAGLAVTAVGFLDLCDLAFDCGCRAFWRGAAEACNIHHATGRHCPWCSYGLLGGAVPFGAVALTQAGIAWWPGKLHAGARILGVLVAFPVVGLAMAAVFGLATGYWS